MRRFLLPLCVLISAVGHSSRASAQVAFAVQPFVGYYRPFGHFDPAPFYSTDLPQEPRELSGMLWGGNLQLQLPNRLGLEGTVVIATSTIPGCTCPGGHLLDPTPERVTIGSVEAQYDFSNHPAGYHLWAGVGPAVIQHGGEGYGRYGSPRSWGTAFSLELAARFATHLQMVAAARGVTYSFNLASPPEHGRQIDGIVSIGLRWHSGS